MRRRPLTWGDALVGLTLVRLGQELGTDSPLAQAVYYLLRAILAP